MSEGYVYLIEEAPDGYTKIGVSVDPQGRLATLQTASSRPLVLRYTVKLDDPNALEHQLHHDFARHRLKGEWFDVSAYEVAHHTWHQYNRLFDAIHPRPDAPPIKPPTRTPRTSQPQDDPKELFEHFSEEPFLQFTLYLVCVLVMFAPLGLLVSWPALPTAFWLACGLLGLIAIWPSVPFGLVLGCTLVSFVFGSALAGILDDYSKKWVRNKAVKPRPDARLIPPPPAPEASFLPPPPTEARWRSKLPPAAASKSFLPDSASPGIAFPFVLLGATLLAASSPLYFSAVWPLMPPGLILACALAWTAVIFVLFREWWYSHNGE